jgi:hypothetical protein
MRCGSVLVLNALNKPSTAHSVHGNALSSSLGCDCRGFLEDTIWDWPDAAGLIARLYPSGASLPAAGQHSKRRSEGLWIGVCMVAIPCPPLSVQFASVQVSEFCFATMTPFSCKHLHKISCSEWIHLMPQAQTPHISNKRADIHRR